MIIIVFPLITQLPVLSAEKFMQNVVMIVQYVNKKVVVHAHRIVNRGAGTNLKVKGHTSTAHPKFWLGGPPDPITGLYVR